MNSILSLNYVATERALLNYDLYFIFFYIIFIYTVVLNRNARIAVKLKGTKSAIGEDVLIRWVSQWAL